MFDVVERTLRRALALASVAALLGAPGGPATLRAQAGTVSGSVVDSKTGRPLADAQISVEGTQQSARTGVRGDFRFTGLSGATAKLRITRIGYQAMNAEIPVGSKTPTEIKLTEMVVRLDELVVTGTPGEAQKRTLGNAVGNVQVANTLTIAGTPRRIQDMLSVNVPGVRITRSSGTIGAGG